MHCEFLHIIKGRREGHYVIPRVILSTITSKKREYSINPVKQQQQRLLEVSNRLVSVNSLWAPFAPHHKLITTSK